MSAGAGERVRQGPARRRLPPSASKRRRGTSRGRERGRRTVERKDRELDVVLVRLDRREDREDGLRANERSAPRSRHRLLEKSVRAHRHVVGARAHALCLAARPARVAEVGDRVLGVGHLDRLHLLVGEQVVERLVLLRGRAGLVGANGEDDAALLLRGGPAELLGRGEDRLENLRVGEDLSFVTARVSCRGSGRGKRGTGRRKDAPAWRSSRRAGGRARSACTTRWRRRRRCRRTDWRGRACGSRASWATRRTRRHPARATPSCAGPRRAVERATAALLGCRHEQRVSRRSARLEASLERVREATRPRPCSRGPPRGERDAPELAARRSVNDGVLAVAGARRVGPHCRRGRGEGQLERPGGGGERAGERRAHLCPTQSTRGARQAGAATRRSWWRRRWWRKKSKDGEREAREMREWGRPARAARTKRCSASGAAAATVQQARLQREAHN